tara:strand:- start:1344 stop:1454 length:111 start_codon:yes stop_codon:yes gene_type:complete
MTEVTTIKLEIPIERPIIANKVVKENVPPLLDLRYL